MKLPIEVGQEDGKALVDLIKWREDQFESHEDKLLWWAAFLCYLSGVCAASLGNDALQVIKNMAEKTTAQTLHDKTN